MKIFFCDQCGLRIPATEVARILPDGDTCAAVACANCMLVGASPKTSPQKRPRISRTTMIPSRTVSRQTAVPQPVALGIGVGLGARLSKKSLIGGLSVVMLITVCWGVFSSPASTPAKEATVAEAPKETRQAQSVPQKPEVGQEAADVAPHFLAKASASPTILSEWASINMSGMKAIGGWNMVFSPDKTIKSLKPGLPALIANESGTPEAVMQNGMNALHFKNGQSLLAPSGTLTGLDSGKIFAVEVRLRVDELPATGGVMGVLEAGGASGIRILITDQSKMRVDGWGKGTNFSMGNTDIPLNQVFTVRVIFGADYCALLIDDKIMEMTRGAAPAVTCPLSIGRALSTFLNGTVEFVKFHAHADDAPAAVAAAAGKISEWEHNATSGMKTTGEWDMGKVSGTLVRSSVPGAGSFSFDPNQQPVSAVVDGQKVLRFRNGQTLLGDPKQIPGFCRGKPFAVEFVLRMEEKSPGALGGILETGVYLKNGFRLMTAGQTLSAECFAEHPRYPSSKGELELNRFYTVMLSFGESHMSFLLDGKLTSLVASPPPLTSDNRILIGHGSGTDYFFQGCLKSLKTFSAEK